MVARVSAFVLLFATAAFAAEPRPVFTVLPDKVAGVVFPIEILSGESVRKQLASGLTCTFLASARGPEVKGATRIEIRYDLWDEVWLVRRIEFDRRVDQQRLASRDALERWWRTPARMFVATRDGMTFDVELAVLPFSAAEQEDARAWLSKSGGVAGAAGGFVDVLIGTTITAKPLITYHWRVDLSSK